MKYIARLIDELDLKHKGRHFLHVCRGDAGWKAFIVEKGMDGNSLLYASGETMQQAIDELDIRAALQEIEADLLSGKTSTTLYQ